MALDINALRAAFKQKAEANTDKGENNGFWEKFYQFFRMDYDQVAIWRFLPDANDDNPLGFIVENKYHQLLINGKKKQIACLKMYGETCPCCEKSAEFYNAGDTAQGKTFWRKIDYLAQGLVINSPFEYPIKPDENPVRLVSMSNKLYAKVETEIVKGDLDEMPYDMLNGYDFRIVKTKQSTPQGDFANYESSGFARKSTPVPTDLMERVELLDLSKFRYMKIEREQMEAMIESHLTGKNFADKEAEKNKNSQSSTPPLKEGQSADSVMSSVGATKAPETSTSQSSEGAPVKLSPQEILKMIKAKAAANGQ